MDFSDLGKMKEMMGQAKLMQEQMEKKLAATVVEASSGGGVVTVRMNGKKEVLRIKIEPTAMGSSASDLELLEDLIAAAVNEAGRRADEAMKSSVAGMMGGLGLPDLPGLRLGGWIRSRPNSSRFAEPMARLIEELRKLPGIGTKSAQRLAFHVLRSSSEDADALAQAIKELKAASAALLGVQQHHGCRSLRILLECGEESASGLRGGRADEYCDNRKDAELQRGVSRVAWDAFADWGRGAGAVADCESADSAWRSG